MPNLSSKGPNFATAEFKEGVVNLVNTSGLPLCITRMVLAELAAEMRQIEQNAIQQESAAWFSAMDAEKNAGANTSEPAEKGDREHGNSN